MRRRLFQYRFACSRCSKWALDLRAKLVDLPGLAEDESEFKPRLRLAVDSERTQQFMQVHLAGIEPGEEISDFSADNLQVMLETRDDRVILH